MSLGASLLRGSHCDSNSNGDNGSGRRFALCDDDDIATDDAVCSGHPILHVPAELARDSGSMLLGTSLLQGHTVIAIIMGKMAAEEDMLCPRMTMMPLMMPFVWGMLFSMHLLNLQETQVVCC
jgi:hypothetical protein